MKSLTAVSAVLPLLLLASGCSKDRNEPRGNGTLNIRLEMDDRIDLVATQACNTKATPDLGAFTLEVTQDETVVHKIPTLGANTSPSLTLEAGDYTVSAYSQPFAAPAFDTPVYGASQLLTIMAGATKDVALECTQTNAGVKINYSDDFKAQHTSYSTRIAHSTGTLDFSGSDAGRTGYFPTGYVDLIVTADGKEYTQAIQLKARRLYTITVKDANVPVTSGHANISISVSTDVTNENVEITFPANGGNTGGDSGSRQTIYGENIGSTDVTSPALVLSFKGWQNQTGSGISYSGSGRIDSQSALQSASYSGASGGNYLTLSATTSSTSPASAPRDTVPPPLRSALPVQPQGSTPPNWKSTSTAPMRPTTAPHSATPTNPMGSGCCARSARASPPAKTSASGSSPRPPSGSTTSNSPVKNSGERF